MTTRRAWLLTLAALAACAWTAHRPRLPARQPLRFACWYWHHPFRLTRGERQQLRAARIGRLYVYGGTVVARGGALRLTRTQQWESRAPCELFVVLRVHPQAIEALLSPAGAARAAALLRSAPLPRTVGGVQWDADIPTARLGEYARFLHRFRPSLAPGQVLSVTALPDWLRAREYRAVCEAVDEVAPQFYGNDWPEAGRRPPPLWETRDLLAAVRRSAAGRARVWVGLPAYGRCVVMDADSRPVGVRHDLDPERLLEEPSWELEAGDTRSDQSRGGSGPAPVEDTLTLHCRESAVAGPMEAPPGTRLWFQWPRADGLRSAVAAIRTLSLSGVEGVCFFRWPAPEEPLAVPTASIAAAVEPAPPLAGPGSPLAVRLNRADRTVSVTVLNPDVASPLLDEGITLQVLPPRGAEVLADGPVAWQRADEPSSARRGDRVVLTRPLLRPGSRWEACQVVSCSGPVQATVRWKGPDGHWQTRMAREPGRDGAGQGERQAEGTR
jgi:hypothetical protein